MAHTTSNHATRYRQASRSLATPRLHQHVSRSLVARRHVNALPTKAAQICMALRHHERHLATRLPTHYKQSYHTIPPIIPLPSGKPRLHQLVSRSPVARRHANALPTKAVQIRMALRHHGRNSASRSAHRLEAIISHDTANHPAHWRRAALTPTCFALPSGTGSSGPYYICTTNWPRLSPAQARAFRTRLPHFLQERSAKSPKRAFRTRLPPKVKAKSPKPVFRRILPPNVMRQVSKTSVSYETASKSEAPSLQNALSPAFRAFDTHDLRRGLRGTNPKRALTCISRLQHPRSPQRLAPDKLPATNPKRNLTCTSRLRHARSPQRVARDKSKTQSHLHFAPSTRTISAEGCPRQIQNAISPALRAFDTHDLRRGLRRRNAKRALTCISRLQRAGSPQRVAVRGAPAAPPPALREKEKKSER